MEAGILIDRISPRSRPVGAPIMHQNWERLLFLHWPIDPALIRPLIPQSLEIDLFDGRAWIGMTPFHLTGLRISAFPPVPGIDAFFELNVRTYVHRDGIPGVWFFSLDASKTIPVLAARTLFLLPYFKAEMEFDYAGTEYRFQSRRLSAPDAKFSARWNAGRRIGESELGSLEFFLVERYALFAGTNEKLLMTRVHHPPWILDEGNVLECASTMIGALGIDEPRGAPLAHFSAFQSVDVWAPSAV